MKIYTCRVAVKLDAGSEQEACDKVKKYCDVVNSYSEKDSNIKMKFIFLPEEGVEIEAHKENLNAARSSNKWLN